MHTKNSLLAALLMALPFGAGCSSEADDAAASGGSGGSAGTGASGGAAGAAGSSAGAAGASGGAAGAAGAAPTIHVSGTLSKFDIAAPDAAPSAVIAGVEVCVWKRDDIPCIESDSLGQYVLPGVPASSEIAITYRKAGYLGILSPLTTGTDDIMGQWDMATDADAAAFAAAAGFSYPLEDTGLIFFRGNGTDVTGVTATIAPSSGVGPVFVDASGAPDSSLTGTSSAQWGLFGNVAPGDVEVTITHPSHSCKKQVIGWSAAGATGRVPVTAGYLVAITAECSP
jgi:hypothetical protein